MDFLKSAVASIAKGPAFPYSFSEKVDLEQSIWTLHNGTKRVRWTDHPIEKVQSANSVQEDYSRCSIFSFDVNAKKSRLPLAKNSLLKFRKLRHTGILRVLDTIEVSVLV